MFSISKKLDITKFDEFKKEIYSKLDAESDKLRNLSKKCEPAIDRLNNDVQEAQKDINALKAQLVICFYLF